MKSTIQPKFGEIYWADLKSDGCIQGGRCPVIIAQNDIGNAHSPTHRVLLQAAQRDGSQIEDNREDKGS